MKMTDQSFEHRCTIVLPQAEVFSVADALKLMALAVRNRDNDGPSDGSKPSIFRWDSLTQRHSPRDLTEHTSNTESKGDTAGQSQKIAKPAESLLTWDDRAERIKASLSQQLYQSVRNGHLNLWSLFCDVVSNPPSDLGDINFWTTTSNIYRSDLIKFCRSQKIKVVIDQSPAKPEEQGRSSQHDDESRKGTNQDVNRPDNWADYKELALAFPAVGKTEAATLEWFKNGSSDRKRSGGFKEAHISGTGKQGRGNKAQFDIFVIAEYLLRSGILRPATVAVGLRKHLGASLENYKERFDALF